jgi:histidinol-phosphate aminotransferase
MSGLIREEIRALSAYHVPSSEGLVKLDAMENPYPLPPALREVLAQRMSELAVNRYPDANPEKLKATLKQVMGIAEHAEVLLGNGSDEIIQILALAVNRPGAVILGVEPGFVMFRMIATFTGMQFVGVPLNADFSLPREKLLEAIAQHQPQLIFLAYPNNPTGNCFDENVMEAVLQAAPGLVVVDEAYFPFTPQSFLHRLLLHPRLLVMRTLSKLGLAGVRLGFLSGPATIIHELEKLRLPYNISVADQMVVQEVLNHPEVLREQCHQIVQDRKILFDELCQIPEVEAFPSQANFILFRVGNAQAVFDGLKARGILVKKLCGAHPLLTGTLRVTVGTPLENSQFLKALKDTLQPSHS